MLRPLGGMGALLAVAVMLALGGCADRAEVRPRGQMVIGGSVGG